MADSRRGQAAREAEAAASLQVARASPVESTVLYCLSLYLHVPFPLRHLIFSYGAKSGMVRCVRDNTTTQHGCFPQEMLSEMHGESGQWATTVRGGPGPRCRSTLALAAVGWRWLPLAGVGCRWLALAAVGCRWLSLLRDLPRNLAAITAIFLCTCCRCHHFLSRGRVKLTVGSQGRETSFMDKATLVRGALAQPLFQPAEPRRAGFYKEGKILVFKK
jgi:hypothetical protein